MRARFRIDGGGGRGGGDAADRPSWSSCVMYFYDPVLSAASLIRAGDQEESVREKEEYTA